MTDEFTDIGLEVIASRSAHHYNYASQDVVADIRGVVLTIGERDRLVAAFRSATAERDALAEIIETNQEAATMKLALDNTAAELERERTQNLAWRALVDASEPVLSSAHDVLLGIDAGLAGRCVSVLGRIDSARAALSTQEESKAMTGNCGEHLNVFGTDGYCVLPKEHDGDCSPFDRSVVGPSQEADQ